MWLPTVIVFAMATGPLSALSLHSRCVTQRHACESAAPLLECCCNHVSAGGRSAATLTKTDPQFTRTTLAVLAAVPPRAYVYSQAVETCHMVGRPLQIDRVMLFGALLI
jgi:hypothetical protein